MSNKSKGKPDFDLSDEELIGAFAKRPNGAPKPEVKPELHPEKPEEASIPALANQTSLPEGSSQREQTSGSQAVGGEHPNPDLEKLRQENERLHWRIEQLEKELALVKGGKKEKLKGYTEQFLGKNAGILESGRFQIYISKDTHDTLTVAHGVLTKIPFCHYVDNILKHHVLEYADIIQEAIKEQTARSLKRFKT